MTGCQGLRGGGVQRAVPGMVGVSFGGDGNVLERPGKSGGCVAYHCECAKYRQIALLKMLILLCALHANLKNRFIKAFTVFDHSLVHSHPSVFTRAGRAGAGTTDVSQGSWSARWFLPWDS